MEPTSFTNPEPTLPPEDPSAGVHPEPGNFPATVPGQVMNQSTGVMPEETASAQAPPLEDPAPANPPAAPETMPAPAPVNNDSANQLPADPPSAAAPGPTDKHKSRMPLILLVVVILIFAILLVAFFIFRGKPAAMPASNTTSGPTVTQ